MAVPVYLNEQSLLGHVPVGKEWDAVCELIDVLKSLKQHGVEAINTNEDFVTARVSARISIQNIFNNVGKLDTDKLTLLRMMLTSVSPCSFKKILDDACVIDADYENTSVLGLAVASQMVKNAVCLSFPQTIWNANEYPIHLKWLDENAIEQEGTSGVQNVCSVVAVEQCPLFRLPEVEYPSSGRDLLKKVSTFFPYLEFSKQAKDQMKTMKSCYQVQQVARKLEDINEGAMQMVNGQLKPDLFKYRANPESSTREKNIPELCILFEDGVTRLCSWHQYFEPGEGRIHFCSDIKKDHIILIGYIGEKLAKS